MRKTILFLVVTLLFSSFFYQTASAENEFNVFIDEEKFEPAAPYTFINWRTMITIDSGLFEKLGATAGYDEDDEKIRIDSEYSTVELTINEPIAYIYRKFDFSGMPETMEMDVAPFIDNGSVYIPLRFAVEGLGALVDWDGLNRSVLITTNTGQDIIPVEYPVEYKEVNLMDIPDDLADWVETNRKTQGIRFKVVGNKTYILISAGEKPTGGYSIQLESATMVAPGSIYVTAQVISPAPDMMVTQVLTYPCILLEIEDEEVWVVDGTISDGLQNAPKEKTIPSVGAAIFPDDITDITLYNLMGEEVKTYDPEEYPLIVEAFNNATVDDSFYIMMITGNRLTISLIGGAAIEITSYGSETNVVATINSQEADGEVKTLHLICPEIAQILLENVSE
ncbi:MAG TPA: hypothetical protein DCE11_03955 [Ruminiclostridium sp.]|jgi:hypothetical protein|nr:protease complex subunit PrcB family protein [Clostridiaceae bacterium]HAA25259.1 hypothetical protein [Ruminiclostridium sp.]